MPEVTAVSFVQEKLHWAATETPFVIHVQNDSS